MQPFLPFSAYFCTSESFCGLYYLFQFTNIHKKVAISLQNTTVVFKKTSDVFEKILDIFGKTSDIFDCIFDGKIEGKMRY